MLLTITDVFLFLFLFGVSKPTISSSWLEFFSFTVDSVSGIAGVVDCCGSGLLTTKTGDIVYQTKVTVGPLKIPGFLTYPSVIINEYLKVNLGCDGCRYWVSFENITRK